MWCIRMDSLVEKRVDVSVFLVKRLCVRTVVHVGCPAISILNSGNCCFCLVQNHLTSCFLPKALKTKIHKAGTLPVVLFRCEKWLVAGEEQQGTEENIWTGGWQKSDNDELHTFHSSPDIGVMYSRMMGWTMHCCSTWKIHAQFHGKPNKSIWRSGERGSL